MRRRDESERDRKEILKWLRARGQGQRQRRNRNLTQNFARASTERVAGESTEAAAVRSMIQDCALGIRTTRADARILAFVADACQIRWTI